MRWSSASDRNASGFLRERALELREPLLLPSLQLCHLSFDLTGCPLEVLRPRRQPVLHALLYLDEAHRVLRGSVALALRELAPALLREPPCLFCERSGQLGPRDGQLPLQLCRPLLVFVVEEARQPCSLFLESRVRLRAPQHGSIVVRPG